MRGNAHVRFGGRAGETDLPRGGTAPRPDPYTIGWLGQSRRLSKDYERLCTTSESLIYAAMSRIMARRLARS